MEYETLKLTQEWDKTANPMTVALAEGMENVTFTAHFKLAEVTLGEGAYLEGVGTVTRDPLHDPSGRREVKGLVFRF